MKHFVKCLIVVLMLTLMLAPMSAMAQAVSSLDQFTSAINGKTGSISIELGASLTVNTGTAAYFVQVGENASLTLDLRGHTIAITEECAKNFGAFDVLGSMTVVDSVGGGAITVTSVKNRAWDYYSAVIACRGGNVVINAGTIEHKGGTDMNYGVDVNSTLDTANLTVNGGRVASTYRAIRAFQNHKTKYANITVNGGEVYGTNCGIWMQQSSDSFKTLGKLTVNGGSVSGQGNALSTWNQYKDSETVIRLNGGSFSSVNNPNPGNIYLADDALKTTVDLVISGGSFTFAPTPDMIAPGMAASFSNGKWVVHFPSSTVPKTGDSTPIMALCLLMALSMGCMLVLRKRRFA